MTEPNRLTAPEVKDFECLVLPPETVEEISPRITLHTVNVGTQHINRITVIFERGNLAQGKDYCVASGMLPRILTEGTSSMSGAEIATVIDSAGAWMVPQSMIHHSVISLTSLNDVTPALLDILTNVVLSPELSQATFQRWRARNAASRRQLLSRVAVHAADACNTMLSGPTHPYMLPITPEAIDSTPYEKLTAAYHYLRNNARIHIYAGGCLDDKFMDTLRSFAHRLANTVGNNEPAPMVVIPASPSAPARVDVDMPGSMQTAITAGIPVPVPRNHPDYTPLRNTVAALGGYFGSRLMTNLREERGLTYGINAALRGTWEGTDMLIGAQCAAGSTNLVLEEIAAELRRLAECPPEGAELQRLRGFLASNLATTLDNPFSVLDYYVNQTTLGTPDGYFQQQFAAQQTLTSDIIATMAQRYLNPDNLRIGVAESPV